MCGWWLFGSRRLVVDSRLDGWGKLVVWWLLAWFALGWLVGRWFPWWLGVVSLVIAGGGLVGWVGSVPGLGCAGGWRGSCRGSRFFWLAGL